MEAGKTHLNAHCEQHEPTAGAVETNFIKHEITAMTGLSHTDGILSMGRLAPGSAASEFFICSGDNTALDYSQTDATRPGYAAFGRVTQGMEVVRQILSKPVGQRDPDDPFVIFVREQGIEILIPSLLNHSVPMRAERVNAFDKTPPSKIYNR